jgi:hypothetical protein
MKFGLLRYPTILLKEMEESPAIMMLIWLVVLFTNPITGLSSCLISICSLVLFIRDAIAYWKKY